MELLSSDWVSFFKSFKKLIVGFSGGLDSTVLLHALSSHSELKKQVLAVHVHHGLSPNASMWQNHCELVCKNLSLEYLTQEVQFHRLSNTEEGAREARYKLFSSLLTEKDCLILGHHRDDQVETLLLQLFRGAGVDGLAAMSATGVLGCGTLARPLLSLSRPQLEDYASEKQLQWIEDESNRDIHYSRNFLRHQIVPLLTEKWPGVLGNIARTTVHCQAALFNLEALALLDCPQLQNPERSLLIEPLKSLPVERLSNILRFWLKKNQVQLPSTATFERLIHEVIFARQDAMPQVSWDSIQIRRYQQQLYLIDDETSNYDDEEVQKAIKSLNLPEKAAITVRYRKGGETMIVNGQTKSLKKLFQEWGVPPWLRDKIPLIYVQDELVAVVH